MYLKWWYVLSSNISNFKVAYLHFYNNGFTHNQFLFEYKYSVSVVEWIRKYEKRNIYIST